MRFRMLLVCSMSLFAGCFSNRGFIGSDCPCDTEGGFVCVETDARPQGACYELCAENFSCEPFYRCLEWTDGKTACFPEDAFVKSGEDMGQMSEDMSIIESCPQGFVRGPESCERVPEDTVLVPEGTFLMGSDSGRDDEKPAHEVYVSEFFIDIYEVTVAQYKACVGAGACSEPEITAEIFSSYNYGDPSRDEHPINGVTWIQAQEYCRWEGKRLPTEAEWEKAARGTDGREYPWGNEEPSCQYAVMDEGTGAGCGEDRTWAIGRKPFGRSPYGVHDMAGNVYEWVSDRYEEDYYMSSPERDPKGPTQGSQRVSRGGAWSSTDNFLRGIHRNPSIFDGDYGADIGFRCAWSLN